MSKSINHIWFDIKVKSLYWIVWFFNRLLRPKCVDIKDIPIIINNRNRLDYMKMLITSLEVRGYKNIYIIDNDSTYPPLLTYYDKECVYPVFRLKKNVGYNALWDSGLIRKFNKGYFVYTDSDVVLSDMCPADILEKAYAVLMKYPNVHKVGPALEVKDVPEVNQAAVWKTQRDFWKESLEIGDLRLYRAGIDTTFALCRPYVRKHFGTMYPQIRMGYPYVAKHMPWYENPDNLPEESAYYQRMANVDSTWYTKDKFG